MSRLLGIGNFFDLLGTATFWYTLGLIAILGVMIFACIKYPKAGKWVLLSVAGLVIIGMTTYSAIQLNIYYSAQGGIHGAISGIFNPNEVKVVDDLTFEFKNIELTQTSGNTYSASILSDNVVSLDTKNSLGIFVNDMPCDRTTEIEQDYVIAYYVYSFYDNDKTLICTDTLTLNFAFYDNSTYLSVSTNGGTEAVKCWNYYFNKNNFNVRIGQLDSIDDSVEYVIGDTSNYATATYVMDDEIVCQQVYKVNDTLVLPNIEQKHTDWTIDDEPISDNYIITSDVIISANGIYEYIINYLIDDEIYASEIVSGGDLSTIENSFEYESSTGIHVIVEYWTLNGERVDLTTTTINSNLDFVAVCYKEYDVWFANITSPVQRVRENEYAIEPTMPEYYVFDHYAINGVEIELNNYPITEPVTISVVGTYYYPVRFLVDDVSISTQSVEYWTYATKPSDPSKVGKTFLGWSIDGVNPVDVETTLIQESTDFIAIFNDTNFTLTIDNKDGTDTRAVVGNYEDVYDLGIPTRDGYTFVEWRISSGDGSLNGTEFTFGVGDCSIYAIWDSCIVCVSGINGYIMTTSTGETYTGGKYSIQTIEIRSNDDYVVVSHNASSYSVSVDTDGEYTITGSKSEGFTITWTGASYVNIDVTSSTGTIL